MSEEDKIQLLSALRNGIGFTNGCDLCLLSPKEVTEYIKANPEYHSQVIQAVKSSARANLKHAQKLKDENKFREWHTQQKVITDFISDITLWEEYSPRERVEPQTVSRAAMIYKTVEECATALGFTKKEFIEYCFNNPDLLRYLQDSKVYNF